MRGCVLMKYKAIFFDRDGTLTYGNKEKWNGIKRLLENGQKRSLN